MALIAVAGERSRLPSRQAPGLKKLAARKLLFISTRFLYPADSGGKIRTTQILRGLKGGRYEIVLTSPAPEHWDSRHEAEIAAVSDRFIPWREPKKSALHSVRRAALAFSRRPIPVASDCYPRARRTVEKALVECNPDVVVADFPHAAVLLPRRLPVPSVVFTHNVEAEIFARHADVARSFLWRAVWKNQYRKMVQYEKATLSRFDAVVAVSERDRTFFIEHYGIKRVGVIPTGVDLEYFAYREPGVSNEVVFTGSMDWLANQDGIDFFMQRVWPLVTLRIPTAKMNVVGRAPPKGLVESAAARGLNWSFTGYVDDVREHIYRAGVYVIPLRVGGGTRLKAYEAMASGCPVVSTSVGVEGLPVQAGKHYLLGNTPEELAGRICDLLERHDRAVTIAQEARVLVESNFSFRVAADAFARICSEALESVRSPASDTVDDGLFRPAGRSREEVDVQ